MNQLASHNFNPIYDDLHTDFNSTNGELFDCTNITPTQSITELRTAVKRSCSPIKICLLRDIDNDQWVQLEPVAKKKKRCNSSNSIGTNGIKKKSSKRTPQGTTIRLYDVFISFIIIF